MKPKTYLFPGMENNWRADLRQNSFHHDLRPVAESRVAKPRSLFVAPPDCWYFSRAPCDESLRMATGWSRQYFAGFLRFNPSHYDPTTSESASTATPLCLQRQNQSNLQRMTVWIPQ
jgi:hypothetical protein